jgi:hypothetical protein
VRSDKRQSCRFPVPDLRQEGELRFGDIRMPIRVLDQSATGFAAMALQPSDVAVGSKGLLRAGDDWFEISLVNCTPIEPPESEDDSSVDDQTQFFRLGLYRLADISDPDEKQPGWMQPLLHVCFSNVMPEKSSALGFGLLFVFIVVVLPVMAILIIQQSNSNKVVDAKGFRKNIAGQAIETKANPDWESIPTTTRSIAKSMITAENTPTYLGRLANYADDLINIIRSTPGASVFMVPEVITKLGITETQKHQLKQIIDTTNDVVNEWEILRNRAISPEEYQKLLQSARNNAMQVLTDDQRIKWQILSEENSPNKNPKTKNDN